MTKDIILDKYGFLYAGVVSGVLYIMITAIGFGIGGLIGFVLLTYLPPVTFNFALLWVLKERIPKWYLLPILSILFYVILILRVTFKLQEPYGMHVTGGVGALLFLILFHLFTPIKLKAIDFLLGIILGCGVTLITLFEFGGDLLSLFQLFATVFLWQIAIAGIINWRFMKSK